MPSGNCISRNAIDNQYVGPSPSLDANIELTSTFTWTVLAAMTDGPMSRRIESTPASRQEKSG